MRNQGFWRRELEFLASAPDGEAQDRWLKLVNALGFAPVEPSRKQSARAQRAGYLDVVTVVRERKWRGKNDPLAYIARAAERFYREGDYGPRRGIVTAKGAYIGELRNPYHAARRPIDEKAYASARRGVALELRLENASEYVPLASRFPPEYRGTYELSPEDCDDPTNVNPVSFEKIALGQGFDEFSVRALMYRVRGVTQKRAMEMEEEEHGRCSRLALQSAWRDLDRHGEWQFFQEAVKRLVESGSCFETTIEARRIMVRRQRTEKRGLLRLDQVAKQLGRTVSEIDRYIRARKLQPANGMIPMLFHPHACDRLARECFSLRKIVDDSAANLAARDRAGLTATIPCWGWPHNVTPPVHLTKGKNKGENK